MDASLFETLADPKRRAIVELLAGGESCVCDIAAALGISDPLASHHVKKLRQAGLVVCERRGLWLHCRLEGSSLEGASRYLADLADRARASRSADGTCCSPAHESRRTKGGVRR